MRLVLLALALLVLGSCGNKVATYTYNVGAKCPITNVDLSTLIHTLNTQELGHFSVDENGQQSITIGGQLTPEAFVLLHEYQHYLEYELRDNPEALKAARHAFRQLMAPNFEIGNADLLNEL